MKSPFSHSIGKGDTSLSRESLNNHATIINNTDPIDINIGSFSKPDFELNTVGPNKLYMQYVWRTYSGFAHYQFSGEKQLSQVLLHKVDLI